MRGRPSMFCSLGDGQAVGAAYEQTLRVQTKAGAPGTKIRSEGSGRLRKRLQG
jgi:hypothetical protein